MINPVWRTSREIAADAIGNLRSLKARGALALVGIAIGTAAVIAMLHIGHNARIEALRQFETMGMDLISVLPGKRKNGFSDLTAQDIRQWPQHGLGLYSAAAVVRTSANIRVGRSEIGATGLAVSDAFYSILGASLEKGRATSRLDGLQPHVVVGAGLAEQLEHMLARPVEIGDRITVDSQVLTVVGILRPIIANMILGVELDVSLLVPLEAARRLGARRGFTSIAARLAPGVDEREAVQLIHEHLGSGTNIQTARQLIAGVEKQMRIYGLLLVAIGAVSLIVGGVGIMNVMLMNVVERRQEIGLRQALGARRRDIRLMFLVEALVLSAAGSVGGVAIGYLAAWIFAQVSNWPFYPSPFAFPLGIAMAGSVGLFFGSYPAVRAAQLDPVAALRSQ